MAGRAPPPDDDGGSAPAPAPPPSSPSPPSPVEPHRRRDASSSPFARTIVLGILSLASFVVLLHSRALHAADPRYGYRAGADDPDGLRRDRTEWAARGDAGTKRRMTAEEWRGRRCRGDDRLTRSSNGTIAFAYGCDRPVELRRIVAGLDGRGRGRGIGARRRGGTDVVGPPPGSAGAGIDGPAGGTSDGGRDDEADVGDEASEPTSETEAAAGNDVDFGLGGGATSDPHSLRRVEPREEDAEEEGKRTKDEGRSARPDPSFRTPWHGSEPPTPPYWLASDPDDSFERTYLDASQESKFPNLRNLGRGGDVNKGRGIKHFFNPLCRHYRFDEDRLPTVSVVITTQNEPDGWVSLTVESILARTPPRLLVDIIVVDDNGTPGKHGLPANIRENVDETEWDHIQSLSPKVRVIRHGNREGCARSRLTGARVANGTVLAFVDSHVEMTSATWYHHLAVPIVERPRTIAMQTIEIIDDRGTKDYGEHVGPPQYGVVTEGFFFGYQGDRFGDYGAPVNETKFTREELKERRGHAYQREVPHPREPYETPFGPGSLFAIRADEFWRLGGYDEGLYVWGGENTELALKAWMCGGRMVVVPCSRAGHMYRIHGRKGKDGKGALARWPPTLPAEMTDRLGCGYRNETSGYVGKYLAAGSAAKIHRLDNFTKILTRNNLRVMEAWVGDHPAKRAYYRAQFGSETLPPEFRWFVDEWRADPAARRQMAHKERNGCHDFAWWDKYVFVRLTGKHHPWHPDNVVDQKAVSTIGDNGNLKVSCGNHRARSCEFCPPGDVADGCRGDCSGADWCHGDCSWCASLEKCFPKKDEARLCAKGARYKASRWKQTGAQISKRIDSNA